MLDHLHHQSRAATCEDWDDFTETGVPNTVTSTNVAVKKTQPVLSSKGSYERRRHDGSDSGYSSRAGTVNSDLSGLHTMAEVKFKQLVHERERHPYAMQHSHSDQQRQSSSQSKARSEEREPPRPKEYRLEKDVARAGSQAPKPQLPKKTRPPLLLTTQDDHTVPRATTRQSDTRPARPVSFHTAAMPAYQYQILPNSSPITYAAPLAYPPGWSAPVTPITPYSPVSYQYAPVQFVEPHAPFVAAMPSYFEQHQMQAPEARPLRPDQRSSTQDHYGPSPFGYNSGEVVPSPMETTSSRRDPRPSSISHRKSRSQDTDRKMMPPPERPPHPEVIFSHRPSMRQNATYNAASTSANRRSCVISGDDITDAAPVSANREHHPSASRPPNSYRRPTASESERPSPPTKSASYSTSTHHPRTTSDPQPLHPDMLPRRTTLATSQPRDCHEVDAEDYIRKRSSMTANDLTAEKLRKLPHSKGDVSERSETGSSRSHKTHHSGSRGSGAILATANSSHVVVSVGGVDITLPKSDGNRKLVISEKKEGGFSLDVQTSENDDGERSGREMIRNKERRTIEPRAPSVASRTSRISTRSGTEAGKWIDREREEGISAASTNRRPSQNAEHDGGVDFMLRNEYMKPDEVRPREAVDEYVQRDAPKQYRRRRESTTRVHDQSQSCSRAASSVGRRSIDQGRRGGHDTLFHGA